jgi:hypothetical protein
MKIIKLFIALIILLNISIVFSVDENTVKNNQVLTEEKTIKEDIEINYEKYIPI